MEKFPPTEHMRSEWIPSNWSIDHSGSSVDSLSSATPANDRPSRRYQTLLLLSGFLVTFQVIGINSSFGIFQEFYTSPLTNIQDSERQDAKVSLIGTIAYGLTWGGSIFVNPLIARVKHLRNITLSGVAIMSLGLVLASFSTSLWHLYISQALLYGIGSSMYYFTIVAVTPLYFDRHRGFAMGVILAGSGVGGMVFAPVIRLLLDKYGIQWALRILGFWNLLAGLPVACVIRHRPGLGVQSKTTMDWKLVGKGTFIFQSLGAFLQAAGNVIPMYYLTTYSAAILSYPKTTGSLLLAVNSGVNSVSRVAMGVLADRIGRQNTVIGSVILSSLSVFALWYDAPRARFIVFVVQYGIYAGGYNALFPTTISDIFGSENYASVNGFLYFLRGLGLMIGAPIAGVILGSFKKGKDQAAAADLNVLKRNYNRVVIYDGMLLLGASLCVGLVRWLDAREKRRWAWRA